MFMALLHFTEAAHVPGFIFPSQFLFHLWTNQFHIYRCFGRVKSEYKTNTVLRQPYNPYDVSKKYDREYCLPLYTC